MTDPLSLLREYNINKREILEEDDHIIFGEYAWPRKTKTNVRVFCRNRVEDQPKDYYTLECLLFILRNKNIHPVYARQAAAENIQTVKKPDRDLLLAYLNGETDICPSVDKNAPLAMPTQVERSVEVGKKSNYKSAQSQKERDKFVAKNSHVEDVPTTAENKKSLAEALSLEKIAAIKAKRLARKMRKRKNMFIK